jgi:hypothetical protein
MSSQPVFRIKVLGIFPDLEVQHRTVERSRIPYCTDDLTLLNELVRFDQYFGQMSIYCIKTIIMANDDDVASSSLPGNGLHPAFIDGPDRGSEICLYLNAKIFSNRF